MNELCFRLTSVRSWHSAFVFESDVSLMQWFSTRVPCDSVRGAVSCQLYWALRLFYHQGVPPNIDEADLGCHETKKVEYHCSDETLLIGFIIISETREREREFVLFSLLKTNIKDWRQSLFVYVIRIVSLCVCVMMRQ